MYHDAPMEAVVHVHRREKCRSTICSEEDHKRLLIEQYQLQRVIDFVKRDIDSNNNSVESKETNLPFRRVALQFPDDKLHDAVQVVRILEDLWSKEVLEETEKESVAKESPAMESLSMEEVKLKTSNQPVEKKRENCTFASASTQSAVQCKIGNPNEPSKTRFFVLADNTFASCCPDEITAAHYSSDLLVHFGDACMSRSTRLPILYIHDLFNIKSVTRILHTNSVCDELKTELSTYLCTQIIKNVIMKIAATLSLCMQMSAKRLQLQLSIIGAHSTEILLENAKKELTMEEFEFLEVLDWCTFTKVDQPNNKNVEHMCHISQEITDKHSEIWNVNGVCFKRLSFANSTASETVQFFVFIGPSMSSHLLHLANIQKYNEYHYSESTRTFVERVSAEGICCNLSSNAIYVVPKICVIDENFGTEYELCLPRENVNKEYLKKIAALLVHQNLCNDVAAAADAASVTSKNYVMEDKTMQTSTTYAIGNGKTQDQVEATHYNNNLTNYSSCLTKLYTTFCQQCNLQVERRLRQRDFNLECIKASEAIGIIVAALSIADYYEVIMLLHKFIRSCHKRSYIIYIGHLNEFKLANFVDTVDCFVAVACPNNRECYFPTKDDNYLKPVVSPFEVLAALAPEIIVMSWTTVEQTVRKTELYGSPAAFSTSFDLTIEYLRSCLAMKDKKRESHAKHNEVINVNNNINNSNNSGNEDDDQEDSSGDDASYSLISSSTSHALSVRGAKGALERLHQRSFVGLDLQLGKTEVQESIIEGKYGIACNYSHEHTESTQPTQCTEENAKEEYTVRQIKNE